MTIDAPPEVPSTGPLPSAASQASAASPEGRKASPSHGKTGGLGWLSRLTWLLVIGLIAFNAYWYWRSTRALPDLNAIAGLMAREQYDAAEPLLREQLRRSPHDGEARTMLAKLLAAKGDLEGCALQLRDVPYWWPEKASAQYREGQVYLMMGRAKDAEATWLPVIEDDPLHPGDHAVVHDASLELLKLYSTEDRWEELRDVLWNAYERAGPLDRITLLSMRIRSELERISPEVAIVDLEKYYAADPDDHEALRALARVEMALGRKEDADRHFRLLLELEPKDPRAWRDYLTMLHDEGEEDAWTNALALVPPEAETEPEIWRFRGLRKERDGDWKEAAEDYRQALERNPFLTSAHYRLAMVEERLGNRESAAEHRKKADTLRDARTELRLAYNDLLDADIARAGQIQKENDKPPPSMPEVMKRLGNVCETLGMFRIAESWRSLAIQRL